MNSVGGCSRQSKLGKWQMGVLASSVRENDRLFFFLIYLYREEIINKVHDDHDFYFVGDGLTQFIASPVRSVADVHPSPHPTGFLTTSLQIMSGFCFPLPSLEVLPGAVFLNLPILSCLFYLANWSFFALDRVVPLYPATWVCALSPRIFVASDPAFDPLLFLRSLLCSFVAISLAPLPYLVLAARAPTTQVRALLLLCAQERWLDITNHLTFLCATSTVSLWLCCSWQSF